VSAAGNLGKGADGQPLLGGIGAPGNAPWVITVGASSHNGTSDRSDDTVAAFSSRGPSAIDFQAKPDIVAPGVGIESLAEAGSTLFNTKPLMRLWGTVQTATEPYLSLSGTSMAAPVVSGTIALMLQANPSLSPNQVKAALQFTAESRTGYDALTQGAGFLNARGAVEMAQQTATGASPYTHQDPATWSGHIIWGNYLLSGNSTFELPWGAMSTSGTWGDGAPQAGSCQGGDCRNIVWGTECGGADCDNIVWGTGSDHDEDNIVWGTSGDGDDDNIVWGTADTVEDVLWSPPAVRRPRRVVAIVDAPLK